MFHTTLSQGKHIAQEREKNLFESKWKGQEQGILFKSKWKGQRKCLLEPKCKGQEKYCRPRSKDRVTNHLYVY